MTETADRASGRQDRGGDAPPFRLKLVPIVVTAVLGLGLPIAAAILSVLGARLIHAPLTPGYNLRWLYMQHGIQLVLALGVIAIFKYWLVPTDYGLSWPRGKTYILPAILWAAFFAVLMTAIDNWHSFLAHGKPELLDFPLTRANVWGWTIFEGVYVGPTEEIPFRALCVTYLAVTMPGKLRFGRYEMNWAGVIVAAIFALAHASSFFTEHWQDALLQQGYAFAIGVLYAYWLEKSKSIIAPIIAHNVSDGLEYAIVFAWFGAY
jgi:uncharacterized protein